MKSLKQLACLALLATVASMAHSEYPSRPIRIVMPFAGGGASDVVARTVGPELAARLGQPVVIENHPGAQGAIAGQLAASAPGDGYTMLYAISATAALPIVTRTTYDMKKNFTPVGIIGNFQFGMFVSPKMPVTNVQEFVAYARAHPGAVNCATLNLGEQYAAALLMSASKIDMMNVPYRSMAQILPDMAAGQVHVYFGPLATAAGLAKEGRLRLVATFGAERSPQSPDVPTLRELGFPDAVFESTQMLYAPSGTPREIVERLSREMSAVLAQPAVRSQLEKISLKPAGSTPEEMRRAQAAADATWERLAREYHLGRE